MDLLETGLSGFPAPSRLADTVSPGLCISGEEFIPRFLEREKECFNCLYCALKVINFLIMFIV